MKTFLLLFILFPLILFSQKRDTTIFENGSYRQMEIVETYTLDKSDISPITHFMGRKIRDSLVYFHENDKIQKIFAIARYHYVYDENWDLKYIEKHKGSEESFLFWKNQKLEIFQQSQSLGGKFEETINSTFTIKNNSPDSLALTVDCSQNIRLKERNIKLLPCEKYDLKFKVSIQNTKESYLQFSNNENEKTKIPVEITGYDLVDDDFLSQYFYKDQLPFDIGTRESIVIKLENGERLLKIYHHGKLVWNHPISQVVNKVDMDYLEEGEYLLEIIDLKTNGKKYCRLKKKGAN